MITCYEVSGLAATFGNVPVVGWAVAAYGATSIIRSAGSIASELCAEAIYKKGMDISVRFSWCNPYIQCNARKIDTANL